MDKLRRESARLSQVQDIAGLRIVQDMTRVDQDGMVGQIVARFPDTKVADRRAQPSHGYRAVHVIVASEGHLVEVQVRTELQHRWAMLVEHLARDWGQQVKYGEPPDDPAVPGLGGMTRGELVGQLEALADLVDGTERAVDRGDPMEGVQDALARYFDRFTGAEATADVGD